MIVGYRYWFVCAAVLVLSAAQRARAQDAEGTSPPYTLGAYGEAYYEWNFRDPSNGITNFRGFDNRHDSFTISNVALDAQWDYERIVGRLTLQVGSTPSTYYLAEPMLAGTSSVN